MTRTRVKEKSEATMAKFLEGLNKEITSILEL